MKLQALISASLFALVSTFAATAQAADAPSEAPAAKAAPAKKAKPHSHMEEKGGAAPKAAEAATDKADASKGKSKHLHPRDGK